MEMPVVTDALFVATDYWRDGYCWTLKRTHVTSALLMVGTILEYNIMCLVTSHKLLHASWQYDVYRS